MHDVPRSFHCPRGKGHCAMRKSTAIRASRGHHDVRTGHPGQDFRMKRGCDSDSGTRVQQRRLRDFRRVPQYQRQPGARSWRWVAVFPTHWSTPKSSRNRLRGIAVESCMPCAPNQCLVGCFMNNPSRMPARESVADKGEVPGTTTRVFAVARGRSPSYFSPQWRISFRQITIRNRVAVHEERG